MEDYEKKYKEALSRAATELETCGADKSLRNMIYAIFPDELKNKDEEIRKALVRFHKSTIDIDGIKGADILAWLEKQGQTFTKKDVDDAYLKGICDAKHELEKQGNNTSTIIWHSIDEKPEEMKELFCEWESDDAIWHDVAFYDEESHTFRHAKMPINVTKWIYVDELLEKQGEQKPVGEPTLKFKVGDIVCKKKDNSFCATINSISDTVYLCDIFDSDGDYDDDYAFLISEQDEWELAKPINDTDKEIVNAVKDTSVLDMVEPKFKVGDWVVISTTRGDRVVQIASVEYFNKDGYPSYITTEGRWFGKGTKARLLTDKDVEITTIPESKAIVNKIKSWSEEDEEMAEDLIKGCVSAEKAHYFLHTPHEVTVWLKSLKDRMKGKEDKK